MSNLTRQIITCTLYTVLYAAAPQSQASGFQVSETGATGLGLAFAGAGVEGEPSDMFHNPAGLMLGKGALMQVAAHAIDSKSEFFDARVNDPEPVDGGVTSYLPNFYLTADGEAGGRYGIGINSPFVLNTKYPADWVGRNHAIKSSLLTLEVNTAAAFKLSEHVSIGSGLTLLQAQTELSQGIRGTDDFDTVTGDDTAIGFNVGIMAGGENGRIGLGYRSRVKLEIDGELEGEDGSELANANADLTLPATVYLSAYQKLTNSFSILLGARHTEWEEFDELRIKFDNSVSERVTPHNWHNASTYSIGLRYQPSERVVFRAGYARDESPIKNDAQRTPNIPDTTRDWATIGMSYQASRKTRVDFAYARLSAEPVTPVDLRRTRLMGEYRDLSTDIFAVQFHFNLYPTRN